MYQFESFQLVSKNMIVGQENLIILIGIGVNSW